MRSQEKSGDRRRLYPLAPIPFLAILLLAAATCAQQAPAPAPAPAAPAGASVVLPRTLVAGQRATLAVIGADGQLLPGVNVEFSGGLCVTTDATGRATFAAPQDAGLLLIKLAGAPDTQGETTTVVAPPSNPPDGVVVEEVPPIISVQDRFSVNGFGFSGDADANHILLGDQPALVLAASPLSLVVAAGPRTNPGTSQLLVEVGGRSPGPMSVTLVALELASDKQHLAPKEKGALTVRVRGTWQRLELEARNLTPDVVSLKGGNVQRLLSSGGNDNFATLELQGRNAGDYSVSVRLIPAVSGLPDTQTAIVKLIAARRMAPPGWGPRIDRMIHKLERHPQEAVKVRNELERILGESMEGEFGRALEAAWRALLKR